MNDDKLKKICCLSHEIFELMKKEYSPFLSNEKLAFINNIDINNFYKVINDKNLPVIYFIGDKYYLNTYYNLDNIELIIPFLCLSSLVDSLNPLKIGLIEEELALLSSKYNLNIEPFFKKEYDIARIVSQSLLVDIPFKIIFKDSDSDIVKYLVEEKGSSVAISYKNIAIQMKKIKGNSSNYQEDDLDYSSVYDYLYDYIGSKVIKLN